jgi:heat shock protein HspQ
LLDDALGGPVEHPSVPEMFEAYADGRYRMRRALTH